jgi:hypothetical protein
VPWVCEVNPLTMFTVLVRVVNPVFSDRDDKFYFDDIQ